MVGRGALCCCEYISIKGQRAHLLEVCCDCAEVDEFFDRVFRWVPISSTLSTEVWEVIQDRIRIPWPGGARQIPLDCLLAFIVIPSCFLLASLGITCSLLSLLALFLLMLACRRRTMRRFPSLAFFLLLWSALGIYIFCIRKRFMVTYVENLLLTLSLIGVLRFAHLCRRSQSFKMAAASRWLEERPQCEKEPYHCPICDVTVQRQDHHCVLLDTCIGAHNMAPYVGFLACLLFFCWFGAWLGMTSACYSSQIGGILLSVDCSLVYDSWMTFLPFFVSLLGILAGFPILCALIEAIVLTSLGVTRRERRSLIRADQWGPRQYGIVRNWRRILL